MSQGVNSTMLIPTLLLSRLSLHQKEQVVGACVGAGVLVVACG